MWFQSLRQRRVKSSRARQQRLNGEQQWRTARHCAQAHSAPHPKGDSEPSKQIHRAPPGPFPVTVAVYANPGLPRPRASAALHSAQSGNSLSKVDTASPNETVILFTAALNGTEVLVLQAAALPVGSQEVNMRC